MNGHTSRMLHTGQEFKEATFPSAHACSYTSTLLAHGNVLSADRLETLTRHSAEHFTITTIYWTRQSDGHHIIQVPGME